MATAKPSNRTYLSKLTYGYSKSDLENFEKLGLQKWLADQLSLTNLAKSATEIDLSSFRVPRMTIEDIYQDRVFKNRPILVGNELAYITILRRLYSSRQVYEMLVEFLSDYVPVPLRTDRQLWRYHYDQYVTRKHALGSFPNLLKAATVHPAMLNFLNGDTNTKANPNENFGRELLELFTVTPAARYTENDVKQLSKLLTGLVWDYNTNNPAINLDDHHFGQVKFFGYVDKNAPTASEKAVLARIEKAVDYLALRPEAATAFSKRLAERFVSDKPGPAIIKTMASAYLKSKGHIPSVLTAMVGHSDFLASAGQKVKRPFEHLSSTVRALELKLSAQIPAVNPDSPPAYFKGSPLVGLGVFLDSQGHLPFNWPFPDGYPDDGESWITLASQVQRWNLGTKLALGRMNGSFADPELVNFLQPSSVTPDSILDDLSDRLYGKKLNGVERADVLALLGNTVKLNANLNRYRNQLATHAAALLISKPEWNLR